MKIVDRNQFHHVQLSRQSDGKLYSLSQVVSDLLESKQLFIHHDILEPSIQSSGPHRHTIVEEVVYILKGMATVVFGETEKTANEGSFVFFSPKNAQTHFLTNNTSEVVETITFSLSSQFDAVVFEGSDSEQIVRPSSHFDKDLRDIPDDPKVWESFLTDLKAQLKNKTHPEMRLKLFEDIGMAARTLMKLDEAELYLMKAVSLSYSYPSHSRLVQNLIRLAHVYQWKKEFEKSHLLFDQAKALINEQTVSENLLAAYHQHLGKLYFDQNYFGMAQAEFGTATSIRQRTSAPTDQLDSSQNSLAEAIKQWNRNIPANAFIRRAVPKDAQEIHQAHMRSIQEVCSKQHTGEEIQGWGNRPFNEEQRVAAIKNDFVLVVEFQNSVEGYGHLRILEKNGLRQAHIFGLYLTPKVIGQSFGKMIFEIMLEEVKLSKIKKVTLESTLTAKSFYRKQGFVDDGSQITAEIGGSKVRCYPMKMEIK
ncbi:MAG: GNAT family N-acetyltransferase [Bdellovibrionales bacterium]|nr:GNAT family N-acetyltransferase [Bdellovibrionales bacterium]